jgi:hypothetical protein
VDLDGGGLGAVFVDEDVERDQAELVGLHQCHQLLFVLLEVLELAFPDAVGADEDKRLGHDWLLFPPRVVSALADLLSGPWWDVAVGAE